MDNSIYLYVNTLSKKHEKSIIPSEVVDVILAFIEQELNDANNIDVYRNFKEKFDNGERMYLDDAKFTYIQRVFPMQVNAMQAAQALMSDEI